jgi:DNA-binding transcriptional ArsR family regulator
MTRSTLGPYQLQAAIAALHDTLYKILGQKPKLGPRQVKLAKEMYDSGELTVQQIADEIGVTRPTIYHHLSKSGSATP